MRRFRSAALLAIVCLGALPLGAATLDGTFRFGKVRFAPADAFAFQSDVPVVVLTSFKIDRAATLASIEPIASLYEQAGDSGNVLVIVPQAPDRCRVQAWLAESQQSIGLGSFPAKTAASTPSRVAGECFTSKPEKMFEDEYEFHLTYDVPISPFVKPAQLPAGGGEPGAQYVALVKAIQASDWDGAHRHVQEGELPSSRAEAAKSNYFENLAANYPKSVTVTGGLIKGDRANLEIHGKNHDGKKIKGIVVMKKAGTDWRVLGQQFYFEPEP